ncbi:hypothetical protein BC829DRAFT_267764 [Chytridium lagenaria]|nr:hypothetical protein BC829DRAFT_267764 [Chytridium lagenaria]
MRWNATSNTGGGCEGNLTRRPFPLCRGQCEALMDSMMTLMADRQACPATDLSLLPLIKPALYKICTDMYGANAPTNGPCVQGVSDEVVTCGFGTAKIAEAVQYCGRQPTDPCCSSNVIIAAASLLPSRSATQSSPIATTTTAPISVASESAHGSDTPKTGLIIGLILSSLFLLVLGIVVVILVGRRYGYSVRSLLVKMTFGLVPRKEEDDVLMGFGTGSMQRLRRPTLTPAAAIMESSAPPMSYADGAGGGNRSGVPNAVWQVAGTMEREGLVGQDGGQYVTGVSFGSGSRERSMSTPPRMSRQGSRGSRESQRKGMESLGRASTRSTGTLVLRKGESFGPETFKTKWHGVTNYLPRLPDEIEIFPGDLITLSTFYNDGWAYGRNERTLRDGYLPLSAVVATGEDSLTRPSVAMTASTSETRSTTSRHGKFATLPPSEAMHHEYPLPNRYPTK